MNQSCHSQVMSCSPYFSLRQEKLLKKLQAEKAFREEVQGFQKTMKNFREKIKAFREKIGAFKMAIQAFWEEEKPIWEEEAAFLEEENAFKEEAETFWREYCDFWKHSNAFWKKDADFWKEDQLLWEEDKVLLDEDRVLWEEEKALWADEKALLEEERAVWKDEEALHEDEKTLEEDKILIWQEAFGPEREDRLLLAVAEVLLGFAQIQLQDCSHELTQPLLGHAQDSLNAANFTADATAWDRLEVGAVAQALGAKLLQIFLSMADTHDAQVMPVICKKHFLASPGWFGPSSNDQINSRPYNIC
ncbi:Coiled-coil domain-containing protein 70 [Aix galericulata]|nr:Coiled-coil domain-containing protein 70 [Aix galericulata]